MKLFIASFLCGGLGIVEEGEERGREGEGGLCNCALLEIGDSRGITVAVQGKRGKLVTIEGRLPHYIDYIWMLLSVFHKFHGVFTFSVGFLSHPQLKVLSLKRSYRILQFFRSSCYRRR